MSITTSSRSRPRTLTTPRPAPVKGAGRDRCLLGLLDDQRCWPPSRLR